MTALPWLDQPRRWDERAWREFVNREVRAINAERNERLRRLERDVARMPEVPRVR